ncbi:MAG: histidine kinase [Bacteroidota bacterium]
MKISPRAYEALGFEDGRIRLISYLITMAVSPFFLRNYGETGFYFDEYLLDGLVSMIHTIIYWEGNRAITIRLREQFPRIEEVGKRLLIQFLVVIAYSVLMALLLREVISYLYVFLKEMGWMTYHHEKGDITMTASIGMGLIPSLLSVLLYESVYFLERWRKSMLETERLQRVQAETQFESLKNQVNPHFLFNSLNTLTALIPQDPTQAVLFVEELAKVYRYVLDVNASQTILLKEEETFLQSYLFLLRARHGDRLQVQVEFQEGALHQRVLPLALQILLENAVKHNVVSESKPLQVRMWTEGERVWVENPLQRKKHPPQSSGLGLNNLRKRYLLLSSQTIVIQESETLFRVGFPLLPDELAQL